MCRPRLQAFIERYGIIEGMFRLETREEAIGDAINLSVIRTVPKELIIRESEAWHILHTESSAPNRQTQVAHDFFARMVNALIVSAEIDSRQVARQSQADAEYRTRADVIRVRLAAIYAYARLVRMLLPTDDNYYADKTAETLVEGSPVIIISKERFRQPPFPAETEHLTNGEWWLGDNEAGLHLLTTQPAEPTEPLLNSLAEMMGGKAAAMEMLNPLSPVALRPYISAAFLESI